MKRYLLFCYEYYYPCGGMNDCVFTSDSIEECTNYLKKSKFSFYHVYDTLKGKYVNLNIEGITFDLPEGLIKFA
jgi:hypothetical protein